MISITILYQIVLTGPNPLRSFRIRRLYEKELPYEFNNGQTHVLVRQLTPGFRDKVFLCNPVIGSGFDALPDIDEVGLILWGRIDNGATIASLNDVVHESSMMKMHEGIVQ